MTLQDPLNQALRRVVLLVGTLIELICTLLASISCRSASRLTLAFFRNCRHWTARHNPVTMLFDLGANLIDLVLVFREVDTVKGHEVGKPDLEGGAELLILLGLAGEHGVHRVLYQVEVLYLWVVLAYDQQSLIHIAESVVRQRQLLKSAAQGERTHIGEIVVVQDQRLQVAELLQGCS